MWRIRRSVVGVWEDLDVLSQSHWVFDSGNADVSSSVNMPESFHWTLSFRDGSYPEFPFKQLITFNHGWCAGKDADWLLKAFRVCSVLLFKNLLFLLHQMCHLLILMALILTPHVRKHIHSSVLQNELDHCRVATFECHVCYSPSLHWISRIIIHTSPCLQPFPPPVKL